MPYVEDLINIENARILWPNFSGKKSQYNREGDRNFNVIIPDADMANKLKDDGWNIHVREPREEGDQPEYRLPVAVSFDYKPPKITLITSRKQTLLDETTVGLLDHADIKTIDMTIRPYNWKRTVKDRDGTEYEETGVKAYLKTMYVVLEEDAFAHKYAEEEYPGEPPFDAD